MLVNDGVRSLAKSELAYTQLGGLWYQINAASLNLAQAGIQRSLHPVLWDPIAISILQVPVFALFGLLGLVMIYLGRKRHFSPAYYS